MFNGCFSLEELDLSNLNTNNIENMGGMFYRCSDQLKNKIREQYKNIEFEAFYEYDYSTIMNFDK